MTPIMQSVSKSMLAPPEIGRINDNVLKVGVKANPGYRDFELNFQSMSSDRISVRITDAQGKLLLNQSGIPANSTITVGNTLNKGIYMVEIRQGTQRKVIKLLNP